eukprot:1863906-Rhodomonas_salina.1
MAITRVVVLLGVVWVALHIGAAAAAAGGCADGLLQGSGVGCPAGSSEFEGYCYTYLSKMTFTDAQVQCTSVPG